MNCPKCGGRLPGGSKFCGTCGADLSDYVIAQPAAGGVLSTARNGAAVVKEKLRALNKQTIIGITAVVAAALLLFFVVKGIIGLFAPNYAYVCLSDGTYMLLTDLDEGEVREIASSKSSYTGAALVRFSPDEKYIYYFTKFDSSNSTGTLCRAEYRKLKKNPDKNDKYIKVIATNVQSGFTMLDDGDVLYTDAEKNLYYFDGKDETRLATQVSNYYTDDDGNIVYRTGTYSDGYTLWYVKGNKADDAEKLAADVESVVAAYDFGNILFTRREDNGSSSLYSVGLKKEAVKLAENVSSFYYGTDRTYFLSKNLVGLCLYNFVKDDLAESDAGVVQPAIKDFMTPAYAYRHVHASELTEDSFADGVLFTSCTKNLYWFSPNGSGYMTMEEALTADFGEHTDAVHSAVQSFVDTFAASADENGYIALTGEVKTALMQINAAIGDNPEWEWLWLCDEKYESGTTTDYDAYYAARDKWYETRDRNNYRDYLKNEDNYLPLSTLYVYKDGKLTAINEQIYGSASVIDGLLFATVDQVTEKLDIQTMTSKYDVRNKLFTFRRDAENSLIVYADGNVYRMTAEAAADYQKAYNAGYPSLYATTKGIFLQESNDALSVAKLKDGKVQAFEILTDDGDLGNTKGDRIYYTADPYTNNGYDYCELYVYENGESRRLVKDVLKTGIRVYDDEVITVYTDRKNGGYELTMINKKGKSTVIDEGVTQYVRVSKDLLLYISEGNLYMYNGKERSRVKSNVDYLWCMNAMTYTTAG
jgi:hypothetical protein